MIFKNGISIEKISSHVTKFYDVLAPWIAYEGDLEGSPRGSRLWIRTAEGDFVSRGVRRDCEQQRGYEIQLLDSSSRFEQHRNCVRGMHTDFHFRREYSPEFAHSAIAGEIVIPRRAGDPTPL
jgi:hypothetical protein